MHELSCAVWLLGSFDNLRFNNLAHVSVMLHLAHVTYHFFNASCSIFQLNSPGDELTRMTVYAANFQLHNFTDKVTTMMNDDEWSLLHQASVVPEFDIHMTVPIFGYSCLDEYYSAGCNKDKVHKIRTPLVSITAADDPFVPRASMHH